MNGAQWVARTLRARGVRFVFVLCGNGLDPFLDACLDAGLRVVDTRNEQAAAYMADTWGRMNGELGVVAVSSGPGHTNALTGLANAAWDGGPMLLISGCSPLRTRGLDHFQELDQVGMAAPVCKYASLVRRVDLLQHEVNRALAAAVTSRPGPVHLTIPVDVLCADMGGEVGYREAAPSIQVQENGPGQPALVEEAAKMLCEAERPMIVVGSGAFYARAWDALATLAAMTDAPILSHIWDRGCIEQAIPQYVGVTNDELNGAMAAMPDADLLLFVGARIDYRVGHALPPHVARDVRIVRIDADPAEINRVAIPDVGIAGSPRVVLEQMIEALRAVGCRAHTSWTAEVRAARDRLLEKWADLCRDDTCPVPGIRICREIKPFLERDVTFLLDGGNIGRWAHMTLFDRHPAHWFTCGASGVVGWGLPGAVAAKLSRPAHPLLLLSGDGAAGFTVTEIETALRFGTPYVAVIAHDGAWGIVADGQPQGRRVASEFGEIRFDLVAQALGAEGVLIEDPAEIGPAIERGLRAETVVVIQVPTQPGGISCWEARYGTA
ncbi:MAG: thiamine pyrophosphate-binding protein [Anaerolineae bacterium]|nr:thiamine pyrophosphate-binding protein [Anaerolineae bacterium]